MWCQVISAAASAFGALWVISERGAVFALWALAILIARAFQLCSGRRTSGFLRVIEVVGGVWLGRRTTRDRVFLDIRIVDVSHGTVLVLNSRITRIRLHR